MLTPVVQFVSDSGCQYFSAAVIQLANSLVEQCDGWQGDYNRVIATE